MSYPDEKSFTVGILNLMPGLDRVATEEMFERRFKGFKVEIVWMHPHADRDSFKHTEKTYELPTPENYERIDYLFRTGANAEFRDPEQNWYLKCLRDSRQFTKGSTSFCWSAAQIYADDTNQKFSSFLLGKEENGNPIKRSGYFDYDMFMHMGIDVPEQAYMACSRHFAINSIFQSEQIRAGKFQKIAVSRSGHDVAGLIKGNDILFFTHNEYNPERLHVETNRCIVKAKTEEDKDTLRAKFPQLRSYEQAADEFGQKLIQSILRQAIIRKYSPEQSLGLAPVRRLA